MSNPFQGIGGPIEHDIDALPEVETSAMIIPLFGGTKMNNANRTTVSTHAGVTVNSPVDTIATDASQDERPEVGLKIKMAMIRSHLERIVTILEGTDNEDLADVKESVQLVLESHAIQEVEPICESDSLSSESSRRALESISSQLAPDLDRVLQETDRLKLDREKFSEVQREKTRTEIQCSELEKEVHAQQLENDKANTTLQSVILQLAETKKEQQERDALLKVKSKRIGRWLRTLRNVRRNGATEKSDNSPDNNHLD